MICNKSTKQIKGLLKNHVSDYAKNNKIKSLKQKK